MSFLSRFADVNITNNQINVPQLDLTSNRTDVIVNIIFGIFGAVAVLIITIGAFRLILSRGNPDGLNKARNTIIYAAIGLLITVAAYGIVKFVVGTL